jgi:hypothetical protein
VVLVGAVAAFTPAAVTDADMPATSWSEGSGSTPPEISLAISQDARAVAPGDDIGVSTKPLPGVALPVIKSSDGAHPIVVEGAQIRGRITDAVTGAPLRDAQVHRVGSKILGASSESGSYELTDVPAGTHELRIERVGYAPQTRVVALTAEAVLETDFAMLPAASVQARFVASDQRLMEPVVLDGLGLDRESRSENPFGDADDPVTIYVKNNNFNDATLWLVRRGIFWWASQLKRLWNML